MAPSARGIVYIEASTPIVAVAFLTVFFRLYTRICISKKPGWEDAFVVIAFVSCLSLWAICLHLAVNDYLGDHYAELSPEAQQSLSGFLLRFWIGIFFYKISITASKATIFLQYIRLFPGWTGRASWLALGIVMAVCLANIFTNIFFCMPIDKFWHPQKQGHCLPRMAVWFSNAGANIGTSMIAILLPLPAILRLHFPLRTKIALVSLFSVGIIDMVIAICRLHSLRILTRSTDTTYALRDVALWSTLECSIAVSCASVTVLRPLLAALWPRYFVSSGAAGGARGSGSGKVVSSASSRFMRQSTRLSTNKGSDGVLVSSADLESQDSGEDEGPLSFDERLPAETETRRFVVDGGRVMEKGAVADHEVVALQD